MTIEDRIALLERWIEEGVRYGIGDELLLPISGELETLIALAETQTCPR